MMSLTSSTDPQIQVQPLYTVVQGVQKNGCEGKAAMTIHFLFSFYRASPFRGPVPM